MSKKTHRAAIFNNTAITGHLGCHVVMQQLVLELENVNIMPIYFWPCWKGWRSHVESLNKIQCDLIIINGEGTIHDDDQKGREYVIELLELIDFAHTMMNVPAVLVNASISSLSEIALTKLSLFDFISVRDQQSFKYLKSRGIESIPLCDLSLLSKRLHLKSKEHLVVTDSVIKNISDDLRMLKWPKPVNFVNFEYKESQGYNLGSLTKKTINLVRNNLNNLYKTELTTRVASLSPLAINVQKTILSSRFIVAGRYHAVALALRERIPFLAVSSNTKKITWLLNDIFGKDDRITQIEDLMISTNKARYFFPYSNDEIKKIDEFLKLKRRDADVVFKKISQLVAE